MMPDAKHADDGFHHLALLYRSSQEYLATLLAFVRTGLARAEPVYVAVPGPAADLLRDRLTPYSGQVVFDDMAMMGRNPARIIPAVSAFVDAHPDGASGMSASLPGPRAPPRNCAKRPGTRR